MKNKIKIGLFALIIIGVVTLCLTYNKEEEAREKVVALTNKYPLYNEYKIEKNCTELPNFDLDISYSVGALAMFKLDELLEENYILHINHLISTYEDIYTYCIMNSHIFMILLIISFSLLFFVFIFVIVYFCYLLVNIIIVFIF